MSSLMMHFIRVIEPDGGEYEISDWSLEDEYNNFDGETVGIEEIDCSNPDCVTIHFEDRSSVEYGPESSAEILESLGITLDKKVVEHLDALMELAGLDKSESATFAFVELLHEAAIAARKEVLKAQQKGLGFDCRWIIAETLLKTRPPRRPDEISIT